MVTRYKEIFFIENRIVKRHHDNDTATYVPCGKCWIYNGKIKKCHLLWLENIKIKCADIKRAKNIK